MKIAIAQINTSVGDIEVIAANERKVAEYIEKAKAAGAELVVFPEMTLPGYPPKDLLLSREFVAECESAQERLGAASEGITVVFGGVEQKDGKLYNSAFVYKDGKKIYTYHKRHLPNYDVFDEKRYFEPGKEDGLFELDGKKIGLNICEDIWIPGGPADQQAATGAELIINLSASPFYFGKTLERQELIRSHIERGGVPIIYVNQVGGQDDIVFDGESYAFNGRGKPLVQAKHFEEDLALFSLEDTPVALKLHQKAEEVYQALVVGLQDFFRKNGFAKAVLGLSGGVDSALVATIAADALGPQNVLCISMPSKFTADESNDYAKKLADNLGVKYKLVPIGGIYEAHIESQERDPDFAGRKFSVTQENIQARIRMQKLYEHANEFGYLVLNTSNKSESAVGYGTMYGDMAGDYAPIIDVYKTLAYELCYYVNEKAGYERIPLEIVNRVPTAELKPGQKDSDSLPPYPVLDRIIEEYVEKVKSPRKIEEQLGKEGIDRGMMREVIRRINAAEHKRKKMPPGTKISKLAFGTGRRMPIANRY